MNNENIVNSIKALCKENDITVGQLEREVGLSQGLVSKWKDKTPSLDKIIDIADYFHVSLDEVVGRNQINISDEFLQVLYDKTSNKELLWTTFGDNLNEKIIKPRICNGFYSIPYDADIYTEFAYYVKYNKAYISINCLCKHSSSLEPEELHLYIQPNINTDIVSQNYTTKELLPLWISVIKNTISEAPSDVLVEDIKQQFISDKENTILKNFSRYVDNIPNNTKDINELISDENAKKILTEVNSPEIQQLIDIFSNPKMAEAIQSAQKLINYFGDIKKAKSDDN